MHRQTRSWLVGGGVVVALVVGLVLWGNATKPVYTGQVGERPKLGPETATVKVEEFSDFQCPACKAAQPTVDDVLKTFADRISFSYRHYPLISVHPLAFRAALAAECANDQGKFWPYHDVLFQKQPAFSRDELVGYARDLRLSLDGEQGFVACLDSRARNETVRADSREGDSRGVNSTPTFFVNGEKVSNWQDLKQVIQGKLIGG